MSAAAPPSVTLIMFEGQIAATAGARRFYLAPHVGARGLDDPLAQFVTLMAAFALRVKDGSAPGPYTDERAERFARFALIEDDEFRMLDANQLDDALLAGHFDVPVDQIEFKRQDLDLNA